MGDIALTYEGCGAKFVWTEKEQAEVEEHGDGGLIEVEPPSKVRIVCSERATSLQNLFIETVGDREEAMIELEHEGSYYVSGCAFIGKGLVPCISIKV